MNIYLISEYVNRLKKSDITYYAEKQGISLDKEEIELIYTHTQRRKRLKGYILKY